MATQHNTYGSFELVSTDEVFSLEGANAAKFLRPDAEFVGSQTAAGKPEVLMFDEDGYLVPDPVEIFNAMTTSASRRSRQLHASRQSVCIIQNVLDHQHAMHMSGGLQEERYLTLDGKGGVGKSYTIEWIFAKLGVPAIIERIPETASEASRVLFGEANAVNPYRTTAGKLGSTVETAKAVYRGRGLMNPATMAFITQRGKGQEQEQLAAQRLYMALHPKGWALTNPEKYNAYWMKVAEVEGISSDRPFIPKLGLFERCARNGMTLFLDEINRLPKEVRDQLMRALEGGKDLEVNGGRVVKAKDRKGMIIAAMNGERANYGTSKLCAAQSRRSRTVTVPDITQADVRASIVYLLSGESPNGGIIKFVQEQPAKDSKNAICTKEFLESVVPAEFGGDLTTQPKLAAIEDFAKVHLYMDEQIALVEMGGGWIKGQKPLLHEPLPSGPTLLKSFFTRASQLIGQEPGIANAMDKLKQSFQENYVQPLINKGVPIEQIESNISFGESVGPLGSTAGKFVFSSNSLFELASCFAPFEKSIDYRTIKDKEPDLLRDKIVAVTDPGLGVEVLGFHQIVQVTEENLKTVVQNTVDEREKLRAFFPAKNIQPIDLKIKLEEGRKALKASGVGVNAETSAISYLAAESPLLPNRGDSQLSKEFMANMSILPGLKWGEEIDVV